LHRGRDEGAIGEGCPDGRQEIGGEAGFYDIAKPACVLCGPGVVGVLVDCEEDKAGSRVRVPKSPRRFNAVKPRHGDVKHYDIGIESLRLSEQLVSIGRSSDYQTFTGQNISRQGEHRRMIIGEQHSRALRRARIGNGGGIDHAQVLAVAGNL
jgi:hypothetical protein